MNVKDGEVSGVVDKVRELLSRLGKDRSVVLELEDQDYKLEDEWLYLCVTSKKPGIRASDYAELLADIEKELRDQQIDNVLLVPAVAD